MLNYRYNKPDQQSNATFPTTKLKNITCVHCSSQFILKNLNDLRRSSVPLLLPCGHPLCNYCYKKHGRVPCSLCTSLPESSGASEDSHPPANIYVVGLIALSQPSPAYGAEPDISFSQKTSAKSKPESSREDHCSNCGYHAILRCLDCKSLLCQNCYIKSHVHMKVAEKHRTILLQSCDNKSVFEEKICTTHNEIMDYFCETCCFSSCHHCMLLNHKGHDIVPLAEKNEEYMAKFGEVRNKMGETLQRIDQAKKKIQKGLIFPEELQQNEGIENAINKHFLHLHGVLQNIEKRLTDQLYKQRTNLTKNLDVLQQRLNAQESQLQSALTMAFAANDSMPRVNLKDIVSKMEKLANDTQCYLVQDPILNTDNINFHPDLSIITTLENHCKLEIPEISSYYLHREDTLPKDYEVEPLTEKSHICIDSSTSSEPSTMKHALSTQSLYSQRSEIQPEKNEGSLIPVKICYVENPSNFYVCRVSNLGKMKELQEMLDNYASNNDEVPTEIQLHSTYAVKSTVTGKWYRGKVTAINSIPEKSETYEVFDTDKGSVEHDVTKEQMRCIFEPLTIMPTIVKHCILFDIFPKNGVWSKEACEAISMYQASGETISLFIQRSCGNTYYVDLIRDNLKRICSSSLSSIRDALIYAGLGVANTAFQLLRKTPNAVRRLWIEDLTVNCYHDVIITHVESPECIYVQKTDGCSRYLQKMMAELNAYYNDKAKSDHRLIYVPEIGITCAAENTDGVWYRAMISEEPTKSRMVTVMLVDFGKEITVSFDKIRTLHEKFMAGTTQAIKTSLADIKPVDGEWSHDCLPLMLQHFKNPCVRVFSYEKIGDTYTVSLATTTGINIAALLTAKGFAISTGPRSSGAAEATLALPKEKRNTRKVRNARTMRKKKSKHTTDTRKSNDGDKKTDDPFKLRVEILRVVSPDTIYVADPENDEAYKELVAKMQQFYGRHKQHSINGEWKIDDQCAVYSACDKTFCRGKIIGFNDPEEAQVFLYDLTYTENIPVADLQSLKRNFWKTPIHAFKVKLAGVRPCGGSSKWLSTSCRALKDLIANNQNCKFYISKVDTLEEEDLEVELWVEQCKIAGPLDAPKIEINSINKLFVASGMALPIKQDQQKAKTLAAELKRQISNANEQGKSIDGNKIMNGRFRKKEHCGDPDSPQKIDPDDDSSLSDQNDSSDDDGDELTNSRVEDSASAEDSKIPSDRGNEQTASEWLPAEPIMDDKFLAVITNVDYDCRLYLHSVQQSRTLLHYIQRTLAERYNNMEVTLRDLVWEKGDLCIAQYHSDKKWYRGQVHRVLENEMIEVEFIDYGNVEECENGTLRKTLTLLDIPRQGIHCIIDGLAPNTKDGKWPTIDLDRIHGVIVDHECDITVLERKPDHLVVSLVMLNPRRCEIKKFLQNDLQLNIRTDYENDILSGDENDALTENDEDVVIDGYLPNDEYELFVKKEPDDAIIDDCNTVDEHKSLEKMDLENIDKAIHGNDEETEMNKEKNTDEIIDDHNESNSEESNKMQDDNNEKSEETIHAQVHCSVYSEPSTLQTVPASESTLLPDNDYSEVAENGETIISPVNEEIISGTINYIHNSDEIDMNLQEAMNGLNALDSISLPDTINGLAEDDLAASTPYDKSFEADNDRIPSVVIPDDVTLVNAEIALVGVDRFLLHLLGNNSSKILTHQRQLYEKMMSDMQAHAEDQPILKLLKAGELCCAKYIDGQWYRSKVLSSESEPYELGHTIRVYSIDFGDCYLVKSKNIRVLKEEWFKAPRMLMDCALWNIYLNPAIPHDETSREICEFFESQQYTTSKKPRKFYIKIENRLGELYQIEMYNDANCTTLTYQPIIDNGLYLRATDL